MKKFLALALAAVSVFCLLNVASCNNGGSDEPTVTVDDPSYYEKFKDSNITINVYNWGEYISDGSDESLDVIAEFEKVSGINVNYTNFDTNEDLYAKLSADSSQYDIIIPSDYMISRMISEGLLEKLDFDNIPNYKYIAEQYRDLDFDPTNEYSVPYTWGTVGIVYNTKYVTDPQNSWDMLWDEKYAGKILMFQNSRDAFGIALKKLGYSLNTEDENELREAAKILGEQKPLVQMYVMDQVFDKMELNEAYIAPYYAGDCLTIMDSNPDLAYVFPDEGTNIFVDSLCIPKGSRNKEAAEAFINFICESEVAAANCEYICYSCPHTGAMELLDEETTSNEIAYPSEEKIAKCESYVALSSEANDLMDSLWMDIRSGLDDESRANGYIVPVVIIIALAVIIFIVITILRKNKKKKYDY